MDEPEAKKARKESAKNQETGGEAAAAAAAAALIKKEIKEEEKDPDYKPREKKVSAASTAVKDEDDPLGKPKVEGGGEEKEESVGGADVKEEEQRQDDQESNDPAADGSSSATAAAAVVPPPEDEEKEEDITSYVVGKKPLNGKVWKNLASGEYVRYKCINYNVEYRPGDAVYMESQRPDQPFYICAIQDLKKTNNKRDQMNVHIKWFYRTSEVPEQVYQLLIQDRHTEHGGNAETKRHNETMYRQRELFISEMTDTYPVSVLRGKCNVSHCIDLKAVREFKPEDDTFFYTLSYNPETRRLASTQGEIRVGASHQANLPDYQGDVPIEKRPRPWGEDISWHPERIHDHDLLMFLHATRSIAAFAKIYDNGATPDEGHTAASKDWITSKAIQTLHESDYDAGKAIQAIVDGDDFDSDVFKDWSEDDIKNFIKGLRSHGKNFFKIREEFLPEKETAKLIEFYYLWKKTPGAASNRPRGRRHRPAVMRRMKTAKGYSKAKEDPNDLSSCSEGEEPDDKDKKPDLKEGEEKVPTADEGGEGEMSPYYCRHCFTTSAKDWHHSGKDKILLCTDCRIYYKRYAELPCLDGHQVGPIIQEEEEEEEIVDIKEEVPIPPIIKPDVEINLNAIEQDSKEGLIKDIREPVEIKAEVPRSNHGILSPVATLAPSNPSPSPSVVSSSAPSPGFHGHPGMPPSSMPPSSSAQSQPSSSAAAAAAFQQQHLLQQQQQLAQEHQRRDRERQMEQQQRQQQQQQRQHNSNDDVQVLSERPPPPGLSSLPQPPPPPQPQVPREPSPPPKPDGSECHRSQSAIFTRVWNRGEGNSCSRTDMIFKPVPETKLYRKREERLRKAQEREENAKAEAAAKRAPPPPGMQPHPLFSPTDPFGRGAPGMHHRVGGGHFPPPPPSHISSEIERREQEQRRILSGGSGGPGGPPPPPQHMARQPSYPPGFGPAPPPPPPVNHHQQSMMEAERRRYQDIAEQQAARASAERQYAERINALATTDPLLRLQMAGINPEIPGGGSPFGHHPSLSGFMRSPMPAPGSLDARLRAPGPGDMLMRPPVGYPPSMQHDMLARHLMLEREQHIAAAAAAQQQHIFAAQAQEQFMRMDEENRARHAAAAAQQQQRP